MPLDSSAGFLGYCGAGEMSPDPYLPFVDHITPRAMLLRDGSVLGTARLAGAKFDLAAGRERNGHITRLTAFLNAIADDNTEAFFHFVRHDGVPEFPRTLPPAGEYDGLFLEEWNRELAGRLRANDWFVSVLVRPRRTPIAAATRTVKRSPPMRFVRGLLKKDMAREDREQQEEDDADLDDRLGQLEDAFSLVDGLLRHAGPRRLGLRTEDTGVSYSEIAEALELIRTTKGIRCRPGDAKMPLMHPPGTIGQMLAVNDPIAGRRGFEVRYGPGGTDSHFGQIYGLTTPPENDRAQAVRRSAVARQPARAHAAHQVHEPGAAAGPPEVHAPGHGDRRRGRRGKRGTVAGRRAEGRPRRRGARDLPLEPRHPRRPRPWRRGRRSGPRSARSTRPPPRPRPSSPAPGSRSRPKAAARSPR